MHPHRGCSGHWPPSFIHVFGTLTLSDTLVWGFYRCPIELRGDWGSAVTECVVCPVGGYFDCMWLFTCHTDLVCMLYWLGECPWRCCGVSSPSFLRAGGERRGGGLCVKSVLMSIMFIWYITAYRWEICSESGCM